MAMNLRLTEEQERALEELARAEGVSKNEAVGRAVLYRAARLERESDVRRFAREAIKDYGPLLDRLAR